MVIVKQKMVYNLNKTSRSLKLSTKLNYFKLSILRLATTIVPQEIHKK